MLCENSWEGGRQYTPRQVGELTLDQFFMLLIDIKILKSKGNKVSKAEPLDVAVRNKDGKIHGRDRDGNVITGRVRGRSLASELIEEEKEKEKPIGSKHEKKLQKAFERERRRLRRLNKS